VNSKTRFSYKSVLSFRMDQDLRDELAMVEKAIAERSDKEPAGDYYFKRIAIQKELQKRGKWDHNPRRR